MFNNNEIDIRLDVLEVDPIVSAIPQVVSIPQFLMNVYISGKDGDNDLLWGFTQRATVIAMRRLANLLKKQTTFNNFLIQYSNGRESNICFSKENEFESLNHWCSEQEAIGGAITGYTKENSSDNGRSILSTRSGINGFGLNISVHKSDIEYAVDVFELLIAIEVNSKKIEILPL